MKSKIYPIEPKKNLPIHSTVCVGIDLGTTFSLMATVDSSEVDLSHSNKIPVKFISMPQQSPFEFDPIIDDEKVASIIAIYNNKPFVGNNLYHFKGKDGFEYKRNMFYHWKIELGVEHFPMYPNAINSNLDMPYKIAAGILNYMRLNFLKSSNQELSNTIITVPASFQANQREDVLKAAKLARIQTSKIMFIDEPNAAFLGYFNKLEEQEKQQWAKNVRNKNILVIDFGGGTLDLSILNVDFRNDKGITIANRAISRYNDLGGQDIDALIAEEHLYPILKKRFPVFNNIDKKILQNKILPQLSTIAEKLKIAISDALSLKAAEKDICKIDYHNISVELDDGKIEYEQSIYELGTVSITGEQFECFFNKLFSGKYFNFKLQDKSVTTISHSITDIIEKSNLGLDEINFVLYVGGSSFNPFLVSKVQKKLVNARSLVTHDPDKLVAEGAAVFSYFYYVHGISLINPITSETIGITLKGNSFFPLIERGTQLPVDVTLPEFKLQSNLNDEVVVPVCINSPDYPIGEIRAVLDGFFDKDEIITIKAKVTSDKVFELKVYIGERFIGEGDFDNPFSIGKASADELELIAVQKKITKARNTNNKAEEKKLLRELIDKHHAVGNNNGVIDSCKQYIEKFDDQDDWVWNMLYIGNSGLGRKTASVKALKKAIELSPNNSSWIYNYSLVLERESCSKALDYLEKQPNSVKSDATIKCKIILLKNILGKNCKAKAKAIANDYKNNESSYSDFDKRVLLPKIFKIAGETFSYVKPQKNRKLDDEKKYLVNKGQLSTL